MKSLTTRLETLSIVIPALNEEEAIGSTITRCLQASGAIREGFRQGTGSLVGFLDADGTCDPRYFAEMSRVALHEDADMVLGSRLGPDSKMPRLRRLGNRLYA